MNLWIEHKLTPTVLILLVGWENPSFYRRPRVLIQAFFYTCYIRESSKNLNCIWIEEQRHIKGTGRGKGNLKLLKNYFFSGTTKAVRNTLEKEKVLKENHAHIKSMLVAIKGTLQKSGVALKKIPRRSAWRCILKKDVKNRIKHARGRLKENVEKMEKRE